MKADTLPPATSSHPQRRVWRIAGISAAVLFLVFGAVLFWLFSIAYSALPEIDGTVAVAGLSAPVSVTRDGHGVPTIDANTTDDLFFAQGYVTAEDRLFQIVLMRRAATGELSEIVGDAALKHDRQQRILGIRATAEKGAPAATPEERQHFGAYARGVNAYIKSHRDRLPLEFRVLRYSTQPWTLEDSLAIGYQMVETLSTSPKAALNREKILARIGPELTADLYVNTSWRDHPPTMAAPASHAAPTRHVPEKTMGAVASSVVPELLQPW